MTRHVSETQIRHWLDDAVVRSVTGHDEEETAFNLQIELSRLPLHVIKDEPWGPVRIVGRSGFDSDRTRSLLRNAERRSEFLQLAGSTLATTPGFYTFLDADGESCQLRRAETIQVEYRLYPDEASQQALMEALMAIASSMRYVQNVVAAIAAEADGIDDETATIQEDEGRT